MKKNVIIICLILLIISTISIVGVKINSKAKTATLKQNIEYEQYLENEIYGVDVVTLINKATSNNEKNNIQKDEKGFYINNNQNSINIDLVMITSEQNLQTTSYKMETISKVGITEFIKNFNTTQFKCTKKEYHLETGKIGYIELTQLPE